MGYRMLGLAHALAVHAVADARRAVGAARDGQRGQGTVEYVALILLVAVVLAGVVAATKGLGSGDIGKTLMNKLKGAIDRVK